MNQGDYASIVLTDAPANRDTVSTHDQEFPFRVSSIRTCLASNAALLSLRPFVLFSPAPLKTEWEHESGGAGQGIAKRLRELGVGSDVLTLTWIFSLDIVRELTLITGCLVKRQTQRRHTER